MKVTESYEKPRTGRASIFFCRIDAKAAIVRIAAAFFHLGSWTTDQGHRDAELLLARPGPSSRWDIRSASRSATLASPKGAAARAPLISVQNYFAEYHWNTFGSAATTSDGLHALLLSPRHRAETSQQTPATRLRQELACAKTKGAFAHSTPQLARYFACRTVSRQRLMRYEHYGRGDLEDIGLIS